ncbi:hypothetical protein [uncultured Fluviicola sp.]|uniref:hypothetical protein n=1 Tax=uncultured Fluviicola sp. TaxID=463303 RepID=UPI0025F9BC1B|nr:hypothetical protein [uncultured Fluviicola sp.]
MVSRIVNCLICFVSLHSFSQGYSGNFEVSDKNRMYHFTLLNGRMNNPVYTILDETTHINSMYLSDSIVLSGIDSITVSSKKDSLLNRFLANFSGTYAEYNKKGRMVVASYYPKPTTLDSAFYKPTEDQRINFYPNGNPYAQFYQKNGHPARSIVYYTRDGEIDHITDLSQYAEGEQVVIQNPYDFRKRKETLKIVIE